LSIVIKTIGKQKYAYQAYRNGGKVTQRYLGNISDKHVATKIEETRSEKQVDRRFHPLFWDVDPAKISIRGNAGYIIERVLEVGDLSAFRWIQEIYPTRLIAETCSTSRKISGKSKAFWNIWLRP